MSTPDPDPLVVDREPTPGQHERTGFFESPTGVLAAVTHAPVGATAGLLICPSLFTEALRNYRREVVLARWVAATGIAAQRFHYRGTGNSSDPDGGMTFAGLRADAEFANRLLELHTGVERVAYLGTRFGGLVAASLACATPGAPVVLIEPVLEAARFFKEGMRAKIMSGFRGSGSAGTVAALMAELESDGVVDLLGDELEWSLYESARDTTLIAEMGPDPRPILIVQLGADEPVRPDYQRLQATWVDQGFEVEVAQVGDRSAWWFMDERDPVGVGALRSQGLAGDDLTLGIVEWITATLGGQRAGAA